MSSKISDERLAELREQLRQRIKGRGGVPEVRHLAAALTELAEYRAREATSEYTPTTSEVLEAWVAQQSHDQPTALDLVEAYESFRRWLAAHDATLGGELARDGRGGGRACGDGGRAGRPGAGRGGDRE